MKQGRARAKEGPKAKFCRNTMREKLGGGEKKNIIWNLSWEEVSCVKIVE